MLYTPSFWALFMANLTTVASFGAFFIFPLFITSHGGDKGDIGIIMGTFALASALCRPWVATMIDTLGRKRSYTLGCLGMTLLPLCYMPFSGNLSAFYLPLLLLRVAHGIALAISFTAVFTFIADLVPPQRLNEGIGIFGISGLVGLAIGPVLGEGVLQHYGEQALFVSAAAMACCGLLSQMPVQGTRADSAPPGGPSFFALLAQRKQMVVALLSLLFGFGLGATGNFVAPLAEQRKLALIFPYYLAYSTAAVMVRFWGGRLADRVGETRIVPYALLVTCGGLFALSMVQGQFSLTLAGFLAGTGHGLLFPVLNTLAIRDEPFGVRGKVTGIFTGSIDAGAFLGSVILGYVGEWAGFGALFAVAGLAVLMGFGVMRLQPAR